MPIARIFTSRWFISAIHAVIFVITVTTVYRMLILLTNMRNDFGEIEDLLDGIGTILVAYGVALEERDTIMRFFKIYPKHFNEWENATDHLCHFYGLFFLLLGLFMEVAVELVKLPYKVFNTEGIEWLIFSVGAAFCAAAVVLLIYHVYLLLTLKKRPAPESS